jgi:hypothetical protein
MSPTLSVALGRMAVTLTGRFPTRTARTDWISTMTPIDATTLDTAGADRSGRKTRPYSSAPSRATTASAIRNAGQNGRESAKVHVGGTPGTGSSSSPRRRNAYVYAA